jgi:hypothetical protein
MVSRDVKFEEEFAYRKSHEPILVIEDEGLEAPKVEPRSPVTSKIVQWSSWEEEEIVIHSTYVKRTRCSSLVHLEMFMSMLRLLGEHLERPYL